MVTVSDTQLASGKAFSARRFCFLTRQAAMQVALWELRSPPHSRPITFPKRRDQRPPGRQGSALTPGRLRGSTTPPSVSPLPARAHGRQDTKGPVLCHQCQLPLTRGRDTGALGVGPPDRQLGGHGRVTGRGSMSLRGPAAGWSGGPTKESLFLANCTLSPDDHTQGFQAGVFEAGSLLSLAFPQGTTGPHQRPFSAPKGHCMASSLHKSPVTASPPTSQKGVCQQDGSRASPGAPGESRLERLLESREGARGKLPLHTRDPREGRVQVRIPGFSSSPSTFQGSCDARYTARTLHSEVFLSL